MRVTLVPPKGTAMTNPHDPDAHYNGHYEKVGYKADFTETRDKDKDTAHPKIVTPVSVHPTNTQRAGGESVFSVAKR